MEAFIKELLQFSTNRAKYLTEPIPFLSSFLPVTIEETSLLYGWEGLSYLGFGTHILTLFQISYAVDYLLHIYNPSLLTKSFLWVLKYASSILILIIITKT